MTKSVSQSSRNQRESEYEIRRPRVGVGVIVIKDNKLLLGKRKGAHGVGEWSIAGGHLEFGESVKACAKRELAEETGLKALSVQLGPWTNDMIDKTKHYISFFAFVDRFEGVLSLLEPHKCERWEWFELDNLPQPLFTPLRSLIEKIGIDQIKSMSFSKNGEPFTYYSEEGV